MKPLAALLILLGSLCAAHLALAQGDGLARAGIAPGRVQILGADMAASCRPGDIERAHRLAGVCEGKRQCSYTPTLGDAEAEACARDSMALWDCGDGKTRYAALAPQGASQSREIKLECAPDVVATAAPASVAPTQAAQPNKTPAGAPVAGQPAAKDKTEVVNVDSIRILPTLNIVTAPKNVGSIDMSAPGVSRQCDRMKQTQWDYMNMAGGGPPPRDYTAMLADIHNTLWQRTDHSPDSALQSPSHWGPVRGNVGNKDCFGGQ